MYIQSIQNKNTFKSTPRYVSPPLRDGMVMLKRLMEAETVVLKTNMSEQVINTRGIDIDNKATFKLGKFLAKKDKKLKKMIPYGEATSMLEFNGVRIIIDDNGKIIEHKKPFYKPWGYILEEAAGYIQYAVSNFTNHNCIKRITQKKEKLTPLGKQQLKTEYKKIMNIFDKINPWSNK